MYDIDFVRKEIVKPLSNAFEALDDVAGDATMQAQWAAVREDPLRKRSAHRIVVMLQKLFFPESIDIHS